LGLSGRTNRFRIGAKDDERTGGGGGGTYGDSGLETPE